MNYGWISEAGTFAQKMLLLGKPCKDYVEKNLEAAGVALLEDAAGLTATDRVLVIRGDAVCMDSRFLTELLKDKRRRLLVPDVEEGSPIAFALDGISCRTLLEGEEGLPSLSRLLEIAKEKHVAVSTMGDEELDFECMPIIDGATYQIAFMDVNDKNIHRLMKNGVVFFHADATIVETDVEIGSGTIVYPGNVLQGKTIIGENCTLYPNNRMNNATIGSGVTVESSVLLDCAVGDHTTVGPYAYLRPKANIGVGCRIGDFVEIKNANIDDGTKVSHLAYVGDAELGKHINVSCGAVFTNYDGKNKYRSVVEDNAFVGCNCNLVAPVHVGKGAYLAAGSTVVEDVPADALLIARSRGTIKEEWAKRRREAGKL